MTEYGLNKAVKYIAGGCARCVVEEIHPQNRYKRSYSKMSTIQLFLVFVGGVMDAHYDNWHTLHDAMVKLPSLINLVSGFDSLVEYFGLTTDNGRKSDTGSSESAGRKQSSNGCIRSSIPQLPALDTPASLGEQALSRILWLFTFFVSGFVVV